MASRPMFDPGKQHSRPPALVWDPSAMLSPQLSALLADIMALAPGYEAGIAFEWDPIRQELLPCKAIGLQSLEWLRPLRIKYDEEAAGTVIRSGEMLFYRGTSICSGATTAPRSARPPSVRCPAAGSRRIMPSCLWDRRPIPWAF